MYQIIYLASPKVSAIRLTGLFCFFQQLANVHMTTWNQPQTNYLFNLSLNNEKTGQTKL